MDADFSKDIDKVGRIEAIPTILDVVCRTTGMGFAAVARVTETRWIACSVKDDIAFGLRPGDELKVESTICHEIRQHREPVIIGHVAEDALYCKHHTPAQYGLQSYISMPIIHSDGRFFGTLCAIDPRPASLDTPEIVGMFRLFAQLIAFHLDSFDKLAASEASLAGERETAALRELFIAVLGHDLRNPVAAVGSGMHLLRREALSDKGVRVVDLVEAAMGRMSRLIDNVLDFARGRLGSGISLTQSAPEAMQPIIDEIVAEARLGNDDCIIRTHYALTQAVSCERSRIAQLASNLLGNAILHGKRGSPILVEATTRDDVFELSVTNQGNPIRPEIVERLFEPFARGESAIGQQGLGLGLYIANQIAKAHGGSLAAISSPDETRFTFCMPVNP